MRTNRSRGRTTRRKKRKGLPRLTLGGLNLDDVMRAVLNTPSEGKPSKKPKPKKPRSSR